jgi:hypothetical protein
MKSVYSYRASRNEILYACTNLDTELLTHLKRLGGDGYASKSEIEEAVRKSEIEVEAVILEKYKPEPDAKVSIIFEKAGRAYAYYFFDRLHPGRKHRHWQRYRVDAGRPVLDGAFPVSVISN